MNRRNFIRTLFMAIILALFGRTTYAEKKPEMPLREAMFWKRLD